MSERICKDCCYRRKNGFIGKLLGWSENFCDRPNRERDLVTGERSKTEYASSERAGYSANDCGPEGRFFVLNFIDSKGGTL